MPSPVMRSMRVPVGCVRSRRCGFQWVGVEAGSVGEDDVAWLLPFGEVLFVGVAGVSYQVNQMEG